MKLDRYSTGIPRFQVFRHVDRPDDGAPPPGIHSFSTDEGEHYLQVDPSECFVLKRRDLIARLMVGFGSFVAATLGDHEYAANLISLSDEWAAKTKELGDGKMPD